MELAKCLKEKMRKAFKITCILILSVFLWESYGETSSLQTPQSTLYSYHNTIVLQDDFIGGGILNGSVGQLGWSVAGSITSQNSVANYIGIVRLDTTGVSGTPARLNFQSSSMFDSATPYSSLWITRLDTNDANTTIRIGAANSVAGNPPNDGIYIEKLDADTNYFCVTRSASTQTRTDSGIAVTTNFTELSRVVTATSVLFYINGVLVCTHTTNIPTVFTSPFVYIINSAAALKSISIDYFEYKGITVR